MSPIAFSYLMDQIKTEEEVRTLLLGNKAQGWQILGEMDHYYLPKRVRSWFRYHDTQRYQKMERLLNLCSLETVRDILGTVLPATEMDNVSYRRYDILVLGFGEKIFPCQVGYFFSSNVRTQNGARF